MTKGVQDRMVEVARIRDALHQAVFVDADPDAALALCADDITLANVPAGSGAVGADALRRFLVDDVFPHRPADLAFRSVSRTGDRWRFVAEEVVTFTHDRELPWLLPGVAATGRPVEVLAISIVEVPRQLVAAHRTLWDHAALHAQLGLAPGG